MDYKKIVGVVLILLFFLNLNSTSKPASLIFKHYTAADGLPSSTLHYVMQDSKGFMWFATDKGLTQYNGYEFKTFTTRDGLTDNTVLKISEDSFGNLWILTLTNKIFIYGNGKITPYKFNKLLEKEMMYGIPLGLYIDSLQNIYISLTVKGILKIDKQGEPQWLMNYKNKSGHSFEIHEFSNGITLSAYLVFSDLNRTAFIYHSQNNKTDSFTIPQKYSTRFSAFRLNQKSLYFSICENLYEYTNNTYKLISKLPGNIFFITKDHDGRLCAGTFNGLIVFDNINKSNKYKTYFNQYAITGFCADNENGNWITTLENGIFYLANNKIKTLDISNDFSERVSSLASNGKDKLYAGFWGGQLAQIKNNELNLLYSFGSTKPVYHLSVDKETSKIYLSNNNPGYLLNNNFHPIKGLLSNVKANYLKIDKKLYYSAAQEIVLKISNDSLVKAVNTSKRINNLFKTKGNEILLGCYQGVFGFNRYTGNVSLLHPALNNICVEDINYFNDQLCFATQGSGVLFLNGNKTFQIDESNGLSSDMVHKLYVYGKDIWCSTNKGISQIHFIDFEKRKFTISNISTNDGLPCNEINDLLILNDTVWVATNSGISFFNRNENFLNNVRPGIQITSFQVNNKDTLLTPNLKLPKEYNNIILGFNGISYKSNGQLYYKYVLKSSKGVFRSTTTNRQVEFLSLDAGEYQFSVQARNTSGKWSSTPAEFNFYIEPAWWETEWFKIVAAFFVILSIFSIYKVRVARLRKKYKAERSQAVLQLTALRAQMNPHFIFNVMNSIRSYIQNHDINAAQKYLTSFAKLVRYTLDNSEVQEITLREEIDILNIYVELEKQRFENGFEFVIKINEAVDLDDTYVPSLMLQPFVENAIKHGISHLKGIGHITIDVKKNNGNVLVCISDNGIGRAAAHSWNESNQGIHYSHGSQLTFNRIKTYNTAFDKNINAAIFDLKDELGNATGTRIEISI